MRRGLAGPQAMIRFHHTDWIAAYGSNRRTEPFRWSKVPSLCRAIAILRGDSVALKDEREEQSNLMIVIDDQGTACGRF